jgi:predicted transcriptional regulator of viral defense system
MRCCNLLHACKLIRRRVLAKDSPPNCCVSGWLSNRLLLFSYTLTKTHSQLYLVILYENIEAEHSHIHSRRLTSSESKEVYMREAKPQVSLTQFAQYSSLFTLEELAHRYGKKKPTRSVRNMLYRLKRQGRVRQLTKGVYAGALATASVNRYSVPNKLRRDAVVAFHSALEFHGVANQVFQTVYYLSVRPRRDVAFDGVTYHCVAPPRQLVRAHRLDFQVESSRDKVRVTGRERSIVDSLAFLPYSGGAEELDRSLAMLPSFDFDASLEYLRLLRMPWLYARLGFLLDRHAEKLFFRGKSRDAFLKRLPRGVAYLDRKRPGNRWVPTWNLMVPETLAPLADQAVRT